MEDGDLQHKSYQNRFSQYSPRGKSSKSKDRRPDLTPTKKFGHASTQTIKIQELETHEIKINYDCSRWRDQQSTATTNIKFLDGVARELWPAQTTQLSKAQRKKRKKLDD